MKNSEEIFDLLKEKFPQKDISFDSANAIEPYILVDPMDIKEVSVFLRDGEALRFDSLMLLSGVDDANGQKVKSDDGSSEIKGGTLSVYYHLYSVELNQKVALRTSASRENPEVESVESVWKAANWHEREAYDLLGIRFLHHPDLRRILMPYDWPEGSHPLRKDYRNPEFYQGMKVPY